MAWSNILFYIAFLSQIFLLSYYFPNKLSARMRYVMTTYPPETYPKLYPHPVENYRMAQLAFKYVNRFVMLLGFVILYAIMFWVDHSTFADDGFISEAWPLGYGTLQFLPMLAIEFSELSQFKQMRKAHSASTRTADLRRRGFTDLVSPRLFGMALVLLAGTIFLGFYVYNFDVSWGHDAVQKTFVLIATNGVFAGIGAWNLYGRKLDPHQSAEDRIQRVSVSLKSLLYISMALSVFLAVDAADDVYGLDFIDALVMSVYFQAIALVSLGFTLHSIKPEEVDFDVYKSDVATG